MEGRTLVVTSSFRWWVGGGLVLVLFAGVMIGQSITRGPRSDLQSTSLALESAALGPVPEEVLASVEPLEIRRGETLEIALVEAGQDRRVVAEVVAVLRDWIDLRRIRPGDELLLYTSRKGEIQRLEYQRGPTERVILEAGEGTYHAYREEIPVETLIRKLVGTVEDNLYFSMGRAGGNAALVVEFADLFAWDFDFFTDTRRGDQFEILVEENRVNGERIGFGRILLGRYQPHKANDTLEAYYFAWNEGKEEGYYDAKGRSLRKFFLKSPLSFRRISSHFSHSRYHPILKKRRPHLGIDYAAPMGTPVVALGNGKISFAGWKGGYGRTVQVKHNRTYLTQYAHLARYAKGIKSGVRVKQGQTIGFVGSSGLSTGPHLDFRVRENGRWINPLHLKGGTSEPLPKPYRTDFARSVEELTDLMDSLQGGEATHLAVRLGEGSTVLMARLDTPGAP